RMARSNCSAFIPQRYAICLIHHAYQPGISADPNLGERFIESFLFFLIFARAIILPPKQNKQSYEIWKSIWHILAYSSFIFMCHYLFL
ncbi:hypothetical protein, partial [uncultured Bacteroides sp.]|uniref:hypothetical protein n=1 Tax=uncultured Bacteroides sp. TaxID=162156 RepID=UPI00262A84B8